MSQRSIPLIARDQLKEGISGPFEVMGHSVLLILREGEIHAIENRCGHFGIPLEDGHLENDTIVCRQHGISFYLKDGNVCNRPYENCEPVKIFSWEIQDGQVCIILDD